MPRGQRKPERGRDLKEKGGETMIRFFISYARYAGSALNTVAFGATFPN
jgi:hypothetical protein